jgi:hypothetical protein
MSALRDREVRSAVLGAAQVQKASNFAMQGFSAAVSFASAGGGFAFGGAGPAAAAPAARRAAVWEDAVGRNREAMDGARRMAKGAGSFGAFLSMPAHAGAAPGAPPPELQEALAVLGAGEAVAAEAAAAPPGGGAEFAALLAQLRQEPPDAECGAKFELFTSYLGTVEMLRDTLLEQARTSRALLPPAAAAALDADIKKVDADGMGVADVEGVWVVHGMAQTARANHAALSRVTRDLETKLRLAVEPGECPMCLDMCGVGHKPEKVLACCHKACADCWSEWAAVQNPPFCPLCRQIEFVEVVNRAFAAATAAAPPAAAAV